MVLHKLRCRNSLEPHTISYAEWGAVHSSTVVCVHGFARNARDFDALARSLSDSRRVICVDLPGRGDSDWLTRAADYGYPIYLSDIHELFVAIGTTEIDWIGTSMGGLLGMMVAQETGTIVRRLVVNDIGPLIPKPALDRIASYVKDSPTFDSLIDVEAYVRRIYAGFGSLSDGQWKDLARHSSRQRDGRLRLHYDPKIAEALLRILEDVDVWPIWDALRCPTLVFRGQESDVLLEETAKLMTERGPKARLVELQGVAHAPLLASALEIAAIRDFLLDDGSRSLH